MSDTAGFTMIALGTSVAAVVGAVVLNLFKRSDEDDTVDSTPTTVTAPKAAKKAGKKKEKKKEKKASKPAAKPAPEPESEPESEEEEAIEEPVRTSSSSKKKKKKAKAKAAEAAAPAPAPAASSKKDKKKKKSGAEEKKAPVAAAPKGRADADDGWEVVPTSAPRKPVKAIQTEVTDGKTTTTINVTGHKAAIIGAKGAVIQDITTKSGAKIDLPKSDGYCTVSGSAESVRIAADMINKIIRSRDEFNASQVEEVVAVPKERIPAVIGKGGSKIKEIQESSKANVNIDKDTNVVTLRGTAHEVNTARKMIDLVVNPPEPTYEATTNMDLSLHPMGQRAVYVILGRKGETIRLIENETGAKLDIEKGSSLMTIKGTQSAVVTALQKVSQVLIENGNQEVVPIKDSRTAGAILGRAGSNIRRIEAESKASLRLEDADEGKRLMIEGTTEQIAKARELITAILEGGPVKPVAGPGEIVSEIACPPYAVGSLIGKAGSGIKSIQEASGAKVDVPRDLNVCWIVGTKTQVSKASSLIKAKIDETVAAEKEREARKVAAAEMAARTEEAFSAQANADSNGDDTWGSVMSGGDSSWGSEAGW